MTNVPDTKLGRLYREHIQLILDKNIARLRILEDRREQECPVCCWQDEL